MLVEDAPFLELIGSIVTRRDRSVNQSALECTAALNRRARVDKLREDISLEDPRENEGGLDLLFFVVHLLVTNILRCFKTEKNFKGRTRKKSKGKGKKIKRRYVLLEKEISC